MRCDAAQFSKMYADVYQDLYRYALCMMKNPQDAEDAVSDAVLAAFENIGKLKNPDAFKSWIFTITTNVCRKKLKALSKKQEEKRRYAVMELVSALQRPLQTLFGR